MNWPSPPKIFARRPVFPFETTNYVALLIRERCALSKSAFLSQRAMARSEFHSGEKWSNEPNFPEMGNRT